MTITQGILCWAAVVGTFAAGGIQPEPAAPDAAYTPEADELGEYDFSGAEFCILSSISPDERSYFYSDSENGDIVSDAVWARNRAVAERFNVNIVELRTAGNEDANELIRSAALSGDDSFDAACVDVGSSWQLALDGYFLDANELEPIDLAKSYWDDDLISDLSLGGRSCYLIGASDLDSYDKTHILAYNKRLAINVGVIQPYWRNNKLYNDVVSGSWTLDKFYEYSLAATYDRNRDGMMTSSDCYGYFADTDDMLAGMCAGAGERFVTRASDGDLMLVTDDNERLSGLYARLKSQFYNGSCRYGDDDMLIMLFDNAQGLFCDVTLAEFTELNDSFFEYEPLPYPKLDESQSEYHSRVESCNATVVSASCPDPEFVGVLLEALASESTRGLLQAYIADCMGINHERGEGSYELLGAALKSRTIDIGDAVYGEQILARFASGLNDPDIGGLGDILAESGDELRALINGVNLRADRAK